MLKNLEDFSLDQETDWSGVRRAYMDQLKVWHPDRFGNDENLRKKGEEKTKELTQAYNTLKTQLSDLEKNGVRVEWDKPILPQLINSGILRFENTAPKPAQPAKTENLQKTFNQEPLVGQKIKSTPEEKISELEENFWSAKLIAASLFSALAMLTGSYFLYENFLAPKPAKIVYGPPADLSRYAKKEFVDPFAKELEDSVDVEQVRTSDGIAEGQMGGVRIISGVTHGAAQDVPEIIRFASRCDVDGVNKAIDKGTSVNKEDSDGLSALSWAAKKNCEQLAKLLLSRGANTNHISNNGFTPLDWARWFKNIEVIRVLELDKRYIKKR